MSSVDKITDEHLRIVDLTLEIFSQYLMNTTACRQLAQIPVVKQIASAHVTQFRILQDPRQYKQLGQFFRVLTGLWLTEDYIGDFHDYLNQLTGTIQ